MAKERSRSGSSYSYSYSSEEREPEPKAAKKDTGSLAPEKAKEVATRNDAKVASSDPQVKEAKVALDNLQEMLAERLRDLIKETDPDRRKDIEKDIEILKQWKKEGAPKSSEKAMVTGATSSGDAKKAKGNEPRHAPQAETKGKEASKAEVKGKVAKEPKESKENPKKSKTSEKERKEAPKKDSKDSTKQATKAKQKDKTETDSKKRPKEKDLKANGAHKAAPEPVKKKPKMSAPDTAKSEKEQNDVKTGSKEVPEEPLPKAADTKVKQHPTKDQLLQGAETIEQTKEALRHLKQKATEAEAVTVPEEMAASLPEDAEQLLEDKVTVLMPSEKVPPCELPLWCVMPNPRDVETVFDIVRVVSGSVAPPKRLQLGRRSWALLGRRLHDAQAVEARRAGVPEPDIGLACPLSSKAHALVLQNWTGKVFLQDLGSAHGTVLGGIRLKPHEPFEWKPGVQAFFADPQLEFFELRVAEK